MAAHIDLSPLLALLTQMPTAANSVNPNFAPYTDPVTGQTSDSGASTGEAPYVTPSKWQHFAWGPESAQIDQLNNTAVSSPTMAQIANNTTMGVRRSNIARMPAGVLPSGTPDELAEMGYGTGQTPTELRPQNAALSYMEQGGTPLDVSATHNTQAAVVQEAANRARTAALAGTMGNPEAAAGVENLGLTYQGGQYGGLTALQPSTFERMGAENTLGTAEARSNLSLLPQRTELQKTELGTEIPIAQTRQALLPYTERTMGNQAVGEAAASEYAPIQSPFGNKVDLYSGTVTPASRNPMGMSTAQQDMRLISEMTGNNQQVIKDSKGNSYKITVPTTSRAPIDVLGEGRSAVNPPLGGGSNNITRTATPTGHEGEMNPPIPTASSSTTLSPDRSPINQALINPSEEGNEEGFESPPSYESKQTGNRQMTGAQYNSTIENNLSKLIKKYGGNVGGNGNINPYEKGGIMEGGFDKNMVTDFIQENAKSMSKDDLKLAVSLMHQLPD